MSTRTAAQARLCTLFDFLGAVRLAEHERLKRTAAAAMTY
jgi:hypothetical protein